MSAAKNDPSVELKPLLDKGVAIWNNGNLDEVAELWDPNVVRTANQLPDVVGLDGIKKVITAFRTAYPDLKLTSDEEIYAENKITVRWTLTGTNTGPGEMPPTGKQIKIWGISILHFASGKLIREIVSFDNQALMEQLGFTMMPMTDTKN
jgi:predicted ester cyclase